MTLKLTAIGAACLIAREGRKLTAYRDSVGVWTIGVGHTSAAGAPAVTAGLRITSAECDAILERDARRYAAAVASAIQVPLADHEADALISLCYNIGPGAFARSSVARALNAGADRATAAARILLWNKPAAVISRRGAEADQFLISYGAALPRARRGDARRVGQVSPSSTDLADPAGPGPHGAPVVEPVHLPEPSILTRLGSWAGRALALSRPSDPAVRG